MNSSSADDPERDTRLDDLIAAFLQAVEDGQTPDRDGWLMQNPELADELRAFFANHDRMAGVGGRLRPLAPVEANLAETPTTAAEKPADAALGTVRNLDDYELLAEIARGGMGVVYRARQISLNRVVALKMILAGQLASEAEVRRFLQEAEAAANLDHPNIVPVYEVGEHQGQPYFSMKYVEGASLAQTMASAQWVPGSKETQQRAARLVAQAARAVHYAHQRGILHRDIKPANILLDAQGQPHVTDFGLARRIQGGNQLTQSGAVVGTPSYMAPEQAAARKTLSTAVDVYSLGAVLYELLTGRPPFAAPTPLDTLLQVLEKEPVRPRQIDRRIDADLETVCLKCLDKDPQRRYGSAEALAEDLERWLGGEPIRARPAGVWERGRKWVKRRPAIAGMAAALALLAVAGFAAVTWQWRRASNALHETEGALAANRVLLAHHEWSFQDLERVDRLLDDCKPEFRGWEWHYLKGLCHPLLRRIHGDAGLPTAVAFSPDGRRVATASADRTVKLWDVATGEERLTLQHAEAVWSLAFSPDGRHLATGSGKRPPDDPDGEVIIWDLTTGVAIRKRGGHAGQLHRVAFSPDGQRLASPARDGTVRIWDVQTGADAVVVRGVGSPLSTVVFSPDGRRLACGSVRGGERTMIADATSGKELLHLANSAGHPLAFSPDGKLLATSNSVWDATTGDKRFAFPGKPYPLDPGSVAFSPDGQRIALSIGLDGNRQSISVLEVATGKPLLSPGAPWGCFITAVAFSPDGLRLASVGNSPRAPPGDLSRVMELDLWDGSCGSDARVFTQHRQPVTELAFDPEGRRLAAVSALPRSRSDETTPEAPGAVTAWDIALSRELLNLGVRNDVPLAVAVSPDGRRIAAASFDDAVIVWDADSGEKVLQLRGHTGLVGGVAFSPDGMRIASVGDDKTVRVWDAHSGRELLPPLRGHKGAPSHVAFSPDGKRIVSTLGLYYQYAYEARYYINLAGHAETRVWDAVTGRALSTLDQGWGGAAFSPDGKQLATGGRGNVVLWDLEKGKEVARLTAGVQWMASSVSWSADGKRLAARLSEGGSVANTVIVWDVAARRELFSTTQRSLVAVALSPDGERVAWVAKSMLPRQDPPAVHDLRTHKTTPLTGHGDGVYALAWFPDGRRLATASFDQTVRVWDTQDRRSLRILRGRPEAAHAVAWGPDGRLAAASFDHNIRIWSPGSGAPDRTLSGHKADVYQVAWSPDGQRLASASADGTVKVWDGTSGREVHTLSGHTGTVYSVAWSPDGNRLASGGADKSIKLWDPAAGMLAATLTGHEDAVEELTWSPDGRRLAGAEGARTEISRGSKPRLRLSGRPIKVWDVRTGREAVTWHRSVGALPGGPFAWSPDGTRLATWSPTQVAGQVVGAVRLWDVATGRATSLGLVNSTEALAVALSPDGTRVATAVLDKRMTTEALAVAFSPDGTRVATAGLDKRVTLWNVATGQEVLTLRGHADWVTALAFSRDGKQLASGDAEGTVRVWDATPLEERAVRTAPVPQK
jgi:WD40 repeat protein/tRNA A-37 threonylcarbamoyl transferase component Bud32